MRKDHFLEKKLDARKAEGSIRSLQIRHGLIDLCSNDYLGMVRHQHLNTSTDQQAHGSTGSRLLSGNYELIETTEQRIASFHDAEAALIFNSGYDANLGIFSSVPQKGDTIIFDQLSHASIRDGIRLSFAQSWSFSHNALDDLEKKLKLATGNIFVVTESIFSMDGDTAPLKQIVELCERYGAFLIVDEAHATGVVGEKGEGLTQRLAIHHHCFARIYTFGKALGCHGAVVVGSSILRDYLVNFARSFIYTTALPSSAISAVQKSYQLFPRMQSERENLGRLISSFRQLKFNYELIESDSPIQAILIPGNTNVRKAAEELLQVNLDVRPILSPTVPAGSERLRVVLHSYNTAAELELLQDVLRK